MNSLAASPAIAVFSGNAAIIAKRIVSAMTFLVFDKHLVKQLVNQRLSPGKSFRRQWTRADD